MVRILVPWMRTYGMLFFGKLQYTNVWKSHKNSTEPRQTQYYDTVLTVQEKSNKNRMVLGVQWHFCDVCEKQLWHAY